MAKVVTLNREQKRHLLVTMLESRLGDLREESLNRQGKGHFHVSGRGHEAMAAVARSCTMATTWCRITATAACAWGGA